MSAVGNARLRVRTIDDGMRIVRVGGRLEILDQIIALVIGKTPTDSPRAGFVVRKPVPCVAVADGGCIKGESVGRSGLREAEFLGIVFVASDQELGGPRLSANFGKSSNLSKAYRISENPDSLIPSPAQTVCFPARRYRVLVLSPLSGTTRMQASNVNMRDRRNLANWK